MGEEFAVIDYSAERIQSLKDKYSLPDEFILSLAMIEPRKNIEALIHAYSLLPAELQQRYPMVLAYKVQPEQFGLSASSGKLWPPSCSQLIYWLPDRTTI